MSQTAHAQTRTVDVLDASGTSQGSVELPGALFDVPANIPLIHQVVVAQLAAARQGTHATKSRGEVSGGGAKPYRQKGTGRARQGSTRAPQYVGGGIVHGPRPHGYAQRTPKKMIAAALRGALSDRTREGRVRVLSELVASDTPSTKAALAALRAVTTSDKVLMVLHRDEERARRSLRNVTTVHVLAVDQLNAYDVLVSDEVVFTAAALDAFVASRSGSPEQASTPEADVVELPEADVADADAPGVPLGQQSSSTREPVPADALVDPVSTPVAATDGPELGSETVAAEQASTDESAVGSAPAGFQTVAGEAATTLPVEPVEPVEEER